MTMNLRTIFLFAAERYPDRLAIVDDDLRLTYSAWSDRVIRLADGLAGCGVQHGDRVAIGMRNSSELATAFFAAQFLGAVAVPFNFRYKADGIGHVLANSGARALLTDDSIPAGEVKRALEMSPGTSSWITAGEKHSSASANIEELVTSGSHTIHHTVDPDDLSMILYTSGTTGRPKGVPLTHRNTHARMVAHLASAGPLFDSDMRSLGAAPLYHTVGLHWVLCQTVLMNGSYYPLSDTSKENMQQLVERERLTFLFGSPTLFHIMLGSSNEEPPVFESVRDVFFGSAPMDEGQLAVMARSFPRASINEVYGTTEIGIPFVTRDSAHHKPGALRPTLDQRVRIVIPNGDPEDHIAAGEVGELIVDMGCEQVGREYWQAPEKTRERVRNGWYYTGDGFIRDEENNYFITGRLDDMFICGGENIQPAEVEQVLLRHSAVLDAAVIGTPDPRWGKVVTAFIVRGDPAVSPEDLDQYLLQSALENFKRPRRFIFVEEIPRNPSGKIVRANLAQLVPSTFSKE
jgi:2-furoate---CoA ligase